ncbi:hypothetical protein NYE76_28485 [Paenibacillus sp. FSL M7-0831]|uniref:hypothetical protein n=1 Tax=Paenibacillus macerans TaxID=44252 RepID=UPI001D130E75|nr:hypothetical protein [Paenibacillus macerans]MBS5909052.1 hypothetical protein [Paenibacillus macerans]
MTKPSGAPLHPNPVSLSVPWHLAAWTEGPQASGTPLNIKEEPADKAAVLFCIVPGQPAKQIALRICFDKLL